MNKPLNLGNRYLIGLFFTNISVFSGLVAVCALIAIAWRALDLPSVRDRVGLLDLHTDLYAPFWPFLVFGLLWLAGWILSYFRDSAEAPGKFARWMSESKIKLTQANRNNRIAGIWIDTNATSPYRFYRNQLAKV